MRSLCAVEAGLLALKWLAAGCGCEVTGADVWVAYSDTVKAAEKIAAAEEVSAASEEMSAQTQEVMASAASLAAMATTLDGLVARFKLSSESEPATPRVHIHGLRPTSESRRAATREFRGAFTRQPTPPRRLTIANPGGTSRHTSAAGYLYRAGLSQVGCARGPRYGKILKLPPSMGRRTPKFLRSRVTTVRV